MNLDEFLYLELRIIKYEAFFKIELLIRMYLYLIFWMVQNSQLQI